MIRDEVKYDWKLCFTDGPNGHSLWYDEISQKHSIKDESGDFPHLTDDGVLWFDLSSNAVVEPSKFTDDGLQIAFKVKDSNNGSASVSCLFDFGMRVAKELRMDVVVSKKKKKDYKWITNSLLDKLKLCN